MGASTREAGGKSGCDPLADRLSDPKTLDALNRVLDRLDVIAFSVEALEGFLGRAQSVVDAVAQGLADLRGSGGGQATTAELLTKLPRLAEAGALLADLAARPEIVRFLDSGLLATLSEPKNVAGVEALCLLGRTMVEVKAEIAAEGEKPPLGLAGLLRALRDPETQRRLSFVLRVVERYGAEPGREPD